MEQIQAKKVGLNFIIVIDGQKFVKVIKTDEDKALLESVKNKVLLYNKRPTKAIQAELLSIFDTKTAKANQEIAVKKGAKKVAKRMAKDTDKKTKKPAATCE